MLTSIQLTPPGRGAIATLLVEGRGALRAVAGRFRAVGGWPLESSAPDRLVFGHFGGPTGEEVVVRVRSPQSVEIHCHGGHAAVAMIQQALVEAGCTPMAWQAWVVEQSDDPIASAALMALAEARTERTAAILLDQHQGALRRAILEILASLQRGDMAAARQDLKRLVNRIDLGLHLVRPWQVVVAGPANAGKSTLVNAILGYARTIVAPEAGTTRDVVTATAAIDGWPVELCDTAGLRETEHPLERAGMDLARQRLEHADLAILVFDRTQAWSAAHEQLVRTYPAAMVLHNKMDLAPSAPTDRPRGLCTSALSGEGIETLLGAVAARLVPAPPAPGDAVPFTEGQADALRRAGRAAQGRDVATCRAALVDLLAGNRVAASPLSTG